jgi:aspartate/methionine/tyrosine aminotransferase
VMLNIHQQLNTNTAAFIQQAALAALTGSQECLHRYVAELKNRAALFADFCARTPQVSGSRIEGGFFGLLNIGRTRLDSDEFSTRLLDETGVAVIPGISFGNDFDDWVRVSLCASTDQLKEGLRRIEEFVIQRDSKAPQQADQAA